MKLRLHSSADLAPLEQAWSAAAARSASVFQSWTFARHWAAVFEPEAEFRICWSASPPIVMPWIRRSGHWTLLGEGLFDYLDFIGEPRRIGFDDFLPLQVTGVPENTPWRQIWLAGGAQARAFAAAPLRDCEAGPEGGEIRAATLDAEHRRVVRRWEAARATLHLETEPHIRRRLLDWMIERKQRQWEATGPGCVVGEREQAWMIRMVEQEPALSELWRLARDGDTLAGLLCWQTPAMRYAYTIAYEPDYAALSPGILALFGVLRHTMREGRKFNFLIGEQAFKQRFANRREPLVIFHAD